MTACPRVNRRACRYDCLPVCRTRRPTGPLPEQRTQLLVLPVTAYLTPRIAGSATFPAVRTLTACTPPHRDAWLIFGYLAGCHLACRILPVPLRSDELLRFAHMTFFTRLHTYHRAPIDWITLQHNYGCAVPPCAIRMRIQRCCVDTPTWTDYRRMRRMHRLTATGLLLLALTQPRFLPLLVLTPTVTGPDLRTTQLQRRVPWLPLPQPPPYCAGPCL